MFLFSIQSLNLPIVRNYKIIAFTPSLQTHDSKDFSTLDKGPLFNLLKMDDLHLKIEEIVIWDNLIKWDIQQTFGLGSKIINIDGGPIKIMRI